MKNVSITYLIYQKNIFKIYFQVVTNCYQTAIGSARAGGLPSDCKMSMGDEEIKEKLLPKSLVKAPFSSDNNDNSFFLYNKQVMCFFINIFFLTNFLKIQFQKAEVRKSSVDIFLMDIPYGNDPKKLNETDIRQLATFCDVNGNKNW